MAFGFVRSLILLHYIHPKKVPGKNIYKVYYWLSTMKYLTVDINDKIERKHERINEYIDDLEKSVNYMEGRLNGK